MKFAGKIVHQHFSENHLIFQIKKQNWWLKSNKVSLEYLYKSWYSKLKSWHDPTKKKCINLKIVTLKSYDWTTCQTVGETVENCIKSVSKLVSNDRRLIRGILIAFRLPIVREVNLLSYGTWKLIKL